MPFSYANPTSGPSAGGIGWFNFGNFSMVPGDSVTGLTGTLNNGNIVTFDLSLALVSGSPRRFDAVTVPTYPSAQFGAAGYTGLAGNVALYLEQIPGSTGVFAYTVSNITVKTPGGDNVPNYSVLIADTESTNLFEGISGQTNGGNWELFTVVGTGNSPTLTGVGSQNFSIVGNQQSGQQVAYVLNSQAPGQLVITLTSQDPVETRQGFAIGFATTRVTLLKNIGQRIDPADQFVLDITGTPSGQATTTGAANGIQPQFAQVYATPGSAYSFNESMAPGSASALSDYTLTVSASNATLAGTVPPIGPLPISFTPALGDDVTYTFLNAAPEIFTKSVDKAYANVGEILTYTVTVDNPNDFAVNNVLVTDAVPAGTTYVGNLTVSAPYTGTDPQSGITITTIGPDEVVTLAWQVRVNALPPIPNPVPNYANVTVPSGTSGMTNVVTTQVNTAFVSVMKMVDKVYANVGEVLTYTLVLNNDGNVAANNVVLTDAVPAGTTFIPGSVTGADGTPPILTLPNPISAGGSATVSFRVRVNDSIPDPNPIPNTPSVAYTYTVDPANPNAATGNRTGNTVTTQVNAALVSTTKTVNKAFAIPGDVLTYTLTLVNNGNTPADNVAIFDSVPAGTTFVPGSVTGAVGTPPTLALTAPIPAGGSAVVSFQVQVGDALPEPNPIPNSADVAYTFTVDPQNPDGATGRSESNTVTTQVNVARIVTEKFVDKAYADVDDILNYTLTLTNTGNVAADNVVLTDAVPAGTVFVPGSVVGATGTPPTLVLTNPIPAGGNTVVSFQVKVGDALPVPNPIPNSAAVTFTYTADPAVPGGESGTGESNTVTTQVNTATVVPAKTVDKAYAQPGEELTYTLTLQNTGNVTANNVVLTDAVPAGTTFVPGSVTGATGTPPTLTVVNPIPAGGSAVVTFKVKVNGIPAVNPIPNLASVAYTYTVDPAVPNGKTGTEKSNTVTTQISVATLKVVKSVDKSTAYLGEVITYHLAVTNTGNAPANNVTLTDLITTGVSYVPGSLTANVPVTGTPAAIQITNPIAPGATVSISFRVRVDAIPNPNPVLNRAIVNYTYPVDPNQPDVPGTPVTSNEVCTLVFRYNFGQQITDVIQSVALEEAALAALAQAEGAKIQKLVAAGGATTQELLCLNQSVSALLDSLAMLEAVLRQKLGILACQIEDCNGSCMLS